MPCRDPVRGPPARFIVDAASDSQNAWAAAKLRRSASPIAHKSLLSSEVQAVYESSYNGSRSVTSTNGVRSPAAFAGASEVERPFTLSDLARVLRMRLWVILLVVVVVVGVAVVASLWQTPKYEASAMLLVGQEQGNGQDTNLGGAVSGLQALTQTMIIAIDTPRV